MNADILDRVNFESGFLEMFDNERKRHACIGAGENILRHESAPDKGLLMIAGAESCDLQIEKSVVFQKSGDLIHEFLEMLDADMLCHFQAGDLIVFILRNGTVIHAIDAGMIFYSPSFDL